RYTPIAASCTSAEWPSTRSPAFEATTEREDQHLLRGGERNRTAVTGFAGPCLNHSATPPVARSYSANSSGLALRDARRRRCVSSAKRASRASGGWGREKR